MCTDLGLRLMHSTDNRMVSWRTQHSNDSVDEILFSPPARASMWLSQKHAGGTV